MNKKLILFILAVFFISFAQSQINKLGVPYIENYTDEQYNAANQNWVVAQDNRGVLYFGNTASILEFDGTNWRQIFVTNRSAVFALAKDKTGKIYVGAKKGELGYLSVNELGKTKYISLSEKVPEKYRDFTKVLNIYVSSENDILFLTPTSLLIYNDNKFKIIEILDVKNRFITGYYIRGKLYFQEKGRGIVEYKDKKLIDLPGSDVLKNVFVTGMFPYSKDEILVVPYHRNGYIVTKKEIKEIVTDSLLQQIYKYSKFKENQYIGGLYSNGIIITDNELNIQKHITVSEGLQNNDVRATFVDKTNNIWLGLNNGITNIIADSPYRVFGSSSGLTSSVLTSVVYNNKIYVGNAAGVYKTDISESSIISKFDIIENKRGEFQIWKIDTVAGELLCAGASGLFTIDKDDKSEFIQEDNSIRNFRLDINNPNILITAGGNGLIIFEFKDGKWKFRNFIKDFKESCRHFQQTKDGTIWISEKNKGVFRVKLNKELTKVVDKKFFDDKFGLPSKLGNYVFRINNKITFGTANGFYRFDEKQNKFIEDKEINTIFGNKIKVIDLLQEKNGNIWYKEEINDTKLQDKKNWELCLLKKEADGYTIEKQSFYKVKNNIHSIKLISDTELLIGTEKGFVVYDKTYKKDFSKVFPAIIRKVELVNKSDSTIFSGAFPDSNGVAQLEQPKNMNYSLDYEYNGVMFSYSSLFYEESEKTQYKFFLEGNDKEWSDWTSKTEKEYTNLAKGIYTFKVKARNIYGTESSVATFTFEVFPPWYQTILAYISYVLAFGLFIYIIVKLSLRRVTMQKEYLERVVEERTAEIKHKNIELNKSKEEIEAINDQLSETNEEISEANKEITASINYAKRIQEAMLPMKAAISNSLENYFIMFKPRDIVSGDFYWFADHLDKIVFTAVDCTGHGVPGAFMSMIGSEVLTTIINKDIVESNLILDNMNKFVVSALNQNETDNQDGMDVSLCVIDKKTKEVEFTGAKNPLIYITDGELHQIKANKQSIGGYQSGVPFTKNKVEYTSPTWFYMFTDGFQDQFGGPRGRKFMIKRMKELLFDIHQKPMDEQRQILDDTIEAWKAEANIPQTDDILVVGFKL